VKTSTGFGTFGAVIEDVELMKEVVSDLVLIKASGGIRDRDTAIKFINAGASRIGTSSGVSIMNNVVSNKK
jgi:deoxyribose-phosphate aldolase